MANGAVSGRPAGRFARLVFSVRYLNANWWDLVPFKVRGPVRSLTKNPTGEENIATYWSKAKPPLAGNFPKGIINRYTPTLGISPKSGARPFRN